MSERVIIPLAASNRAQPLLQPSQSYPRAGTRLGEAVGGTAAVCCCFSFGIANMMYLTMYKVPAKLCQKAIRRKRQQRRLLESMSEGETAPSRRARCTCGCCDDIIGAGRVYPLCSGDNGDMAVLRNRRSVTKDEDVVELENEMWGKFYDTGFWRSPSQRENSSQPRQRTNALSSPNFKVIPVI